MRTFDSRSSVLNEPSGDLSTRSPRAVSPARQISGDDGSEYVLKRRTGKGTMHLHDAEEIMDKLLFDDESKGGEYLKGLISSKGLSVAWQKLLKRLKQVEEVTGLQATGSFVRRERSSMQPEEFARTFSTIKDCREIVTEEYEGRLSSNEHRLRALEAASEAVLQRFKANEKDLSDVHSELKQHWQTIESVQKDILRVELQDRDHHKEALDLNQQLRSEILRQEATSEEGRRALVNRQDDEIGYRENLLEKFEELRAFLYSAGLQKQLEQICVDMLSQYVSWEDMKSEREVIHTRAVGSATAPLQKEIKQFKQEMQVSTSNLASKDTGLNNDLLALGEKVTGMNQKLLDRIDEVVAQVSQRALDTRLSDVEKRLIARDDYHEIDFAEFKELETRKVEEAFQKVAELEASLFAHEHALEHWAEEIGNRATKYDTMVLTSRLDKCALKDKTDADYKEVQKTLKWQSVKIENLTFKSSFGSETAEAAPPTAPPARTSQRASRKAQRDAAQSTRRSTKDESPAEPTDEESPSNSMRNSKQRQSVMSSGSAKDEDAVGERPSTASTPPQPPSPTSPQAASQVAPQPVAQRSVTISTNSHYQPDSEMHAMLAQQLESLAHCVLGLCHASLRTAVCGLSREARHEREDRLIFHTSSLIYWITHRAAPPDWDPMELTTLALKCMENNTEERRKSHHHDFHHSSSEFSRTSTAETDKRQPQLSRMDTWAAKHLKTALQQHTEDHLPVESVALAHPVHRRQQQSSERGGVSIATAPKKKETIEVVAQRKHPSKERHPSKEAKAPTDQGHDRMRDLVMGVFGAQEPQGKDSSVADMALPRLSVGGSKSAR